MTVIKKTILLVGVALPLVLASCSTYKSAQYAPHLQNLQKVHTTLDDWEDQEPAAAQELEPFIFEPSSPTVSS